MSDPVVSTMQDTQLTITSLLRHGSTVFADSLVHTFEGDSRAAARPPTPRSAPAPPGSPGRWPGSACEPGDRVGTFLWNTQEHLEAYLAVPSMGAVLHTLNLRLFPEQLAYVIDHAGTR